MKRWNMVLDIFTLKFFRNKSLYTTIENENNETNEENLTKDEDVAAEEERILSGKGSSDIVVLNKLTKIYANGKVAVKEMSLGIPTGEVRAAVQVCF